MLLWKWKRRVRIVPQEASITKFQVGFLNQNRHPQTHLNLQYHTLPKTNPWQIFVELMWTELFRNSYFAIFCRATNRQQIWICDFKKTFPFLHKLETLLGCSWSQTVDKQHPYLLHFWCKRRNTKSKGKYIRCRTSSDLIFKRLPSYSENNF